MKQVNKESEAMWKRTVGQSFQDIFKSFTEKRHQKLGRRPHTANHG
jgi:hypothetical protein